MKKPKKLSFNPAVYLAALLSMRNPGSVGGIAPKGVPEQHRCSFCGAPNTNRGGFCNAEHAAKYKKLRKEGKIQ